jgi:hypothetical protein
MGSTYGQRHGLSGYDAFRTGLRFAQVQQMLRVESSDPHDWRQKSRGCVLGLWHSLKMALYDRSCDAIAKGPSVELVEEWDADLECNVKRFDVTGNVRSVQFRSNKRPDWFVIIHQSTQTPGAWQVSHFDHLGAIGHTERATLEDALDSYELKNMMHVERVL